jgi:hypothetical protein
VAKKTKRKNGPKIPPLPDYRKLPKPIDWEAVFDPRRKAVELPWFTALIPDPLFFKAIIITLLLLNEVKAGLSGVGGKTGNAAALTEWRGLLLTAVYTKLQQGGDWENDGAQVLKVAKDMGTIAGLLAGSKPEAGVNQLKSAYAATKAHETCTAASSGVGGGAWCPFNWI